MTARSHSHKPSKTAAPTPVAPCIESPLPTRLLAWPEAVVIIVIVLAAITMVLTGTTTHSVLVLLGGATMIGVAAVVATTTKSVSRVTAALRYALAATV